MANTDIGSDTAERVIDLLGNPDRFFGMVLPSANAPSSARQKTTRSGEHRREEGRAQMFPDQVAFGHYSG
jgi:hypothetical protein